MKILAIRGCNLASLAGEFEIDLARAPLGDAGVFAIVGNTGAGKSTLLDALCVALFDRTPRLTNHSRVVIGRGEDDPGALGAQDARTLLRRGAASGWAEVDFESGDRRRYRARWSVRRARGKTDGALQDQQLTLTAIDGGERLGGTKTETLKAIVGRLGLTFDQFRRSALLAQGEFAAFLRADGRDRSELLERMTGTEVYSRLSIRAHVKAALAEQQLREGRAAALAIPVLEDGARDTAEAELALAHDARAAARIRLVEAEAAARWRAEAELLARAVTEAELAAGAADGAVARAAPERAALAVQRRAEQLRGPWDEAARAERAWLVAKAEHAAAEDAAKAASEAQAEIAARRGAIDELYAPIRDARIAARIVERAGPARRPAAGAPAIAAAEAEAAARASLGAAAWLSARAALAAELAAWGELEARLSEQLALADAVVGIDRVLQGHAEARVALVATRETLIGEHQAALARLGEAQRRAVAYQQKRGLTLDAARRQEDQARAHLLEVERLVAIAAAARQAVTARDELSRQLAELDDATRADRRQRLDLDGAHATDLIRRDERARTLDDLRRAAGFEHARAELRAGEPCPLCGATEHPWHGRGAFDDAIREAEGRLAEVVAKLDASTAALALLDARAQHRRKEQVRLDNHRATAIASAEGTVGTWREQMTALGELMLIDDPALPAAEALAADREASAKQRLDAARATRHQTEAATKAAADAQAEVQLAQTGADQLAARAAELERKLAELDTAIEHRRADRASRLVRIGELAALLDDAILRWSRALPAAPRRPSKPASPAERAIAAAEEVVHDHAAESRARVAARRERGAGTGSGPGLAPGPEDNLAALSAQLERVRGAMSAIAEAWTARAEGVAHAETALVAAIGGIERAAREAERAVAEQMTRLLDAGQRRDARAAEAAAATAALESVQLDAGFGTGELGRLLAADPARADQLADQLAALDRSVDLARAVVIERRQKADDHARGRPDELADADRVPALAAAAEDADERAARLAATLAADADARRRRADAFSALAPAEAAAEVDRILGEVIGSHDGKLFRSFAQSLTLDGLLAVANAHLEELAPRYQLERVPRHDLELQVIDRDLGAEVRSVQSLSGGESFLVSLALALGLSSMSAHDVRVRTLLIDEGFGTLDPATLDSALSVLDALQATGRQVGVISHVPALVERVGAHVRVIQRGGGRSEVVVS